MSYALCASCGDYIRLAHDQTKYRNVDGKPRCNECADELEHGKVGPPPRNRLDALAEHLTPRQRAKLTHTGG